MLVRVNKLPTENIIVVTYAAPFEPQKDITKAQEEIAQILDAHDRIMYRIDDLSDAKMEWKTFVTGIYIATRDVPGSMTDKRIRGVLVGEDEMVKMASEKMKLEPYGATQTPMFTTMAAAINHAKKQLRLEAV